MFILHWARTSSKIIKQKQSVFMARSLISPFKIAHFSVSNFLFKMLTILLENKVCVRGRDMQEKIPIHIAAENGSLDCVVTLAKYPLFASYVDQREARGMTALHFAANNKHA